MCFFGVYGNYRYDSDVFHVDNTFTFHGRLAPKSHSNTTVNVKKAYQQT